jgi:hypothetical protein
MFTSDADGNESAEPHSGNQIVVGLGRIIGNTGVVRNPVPSDVREQGKHGGDRKSKSAKNQAGNASLIYNPVPQVLARLTRDRPDLAERVRAGELSAHAAAIEAGFRKKRARVELSLLDQVWKRILKLTPVRVKGRLLAYRIGL